MKRLKKFVSVLLFAAMLVPMFVMPVGVSASPNSDVSFSGETILYNENFEDWTDEKVCSIRGGDHQGSLSYHEFNPWNTQIATTGKSSTKSLSPTFGAGHDDRSLFFNIKPEETKGCYHFRFDFRFGSIENDSSTKIALARTAYGNDPITVFDATQLKSMGDDWYNIDIKINLDDRSWTATATKDGATTASVSTSGTSFYADHSEWIPKTLFFFCKSTTPTSRTIDNVPLVDNFYYTVENVTLQDTAFAVKDADDNALSDLTAVAPESAAKITIDFGRTMDEATLSNVTITSGTETVAYDGAVSGTVYTLTPKSALLYNASYSVNVGKGVKTSTKVDVSEKSFKFKTETKTVSFPDETIKYSENFEDWTDAYITSIRGSNTQGKQTTHGFNPWSTKIATVGKNSERSLSPVYDNTTNNTRELFFNIVPNETKGSYHFRFDFRFGTSENGANSEIKLARDVFGDDVATVFDATTLQGMGSNWYNVDIKVNLDEKKWEATATPYEATLSTITKNGTWTTDYVPVTLDFYCHSTNASGRNMNNVPLVDNFYYTVEIDKSLTLTESAFTVHDTDGQVISERENIDPKKVKKVVVDFGKDMAADAQNYITFKCGNTAVSGTTSLEGGVYTFVPSGNLKYSSTYKVEIANGAKTAEGGKVTPIDFSFGTMKKAVNFVGEAILYGTDFEDWTNDTVAAIRGKSPSSHEFQPWTSSIALDGMESNKGLSPVYDTTNKSRKLRFILAPKEEKGIYHFRFDFRFGTSEGKQTNDANESGESSISLDRTGNSNDPVTIFGLSDLQAMGANWYNIDIKVNVDNAAWTATATPYNTDLTTVTRSGDLLSGINPQALCFNCYLDDAKSASDRTGANVPLVDNFYYTLETAGDYSVVRIPAVTSNGETVSGIENCANGQPLNVKVYYANATAADKDLCLLIAGYDANGTMTTLKLADAEKMKKGGYGTIDISSDAIPTDTKMVKIILCDGVGSMIPYCDVMTFGAVENAVNKTTTAPYVAEYDFVNEKIDLYGAANAKESVAVTVLKNGYTFEGLASLSEAQRQAAVLYTSVQTLGANDTNFAFTINYDDTCVDATTGKADLQARIVTNGGATVQNVTLTPVSAAAYKKAVQDINGKAADTAVTNADFATFVMSVADKLQFEFVPYSDTEVDGDVLAAFRAHVAQTPLSETDAAGNISVLKKYLVISGIKDGKTDNVNAYVSTLFAADDALRTSYDKVALTEDIQKYFTTKISTALSGTAAPTTTDFDTAWKKALILTTARYGNGYGTLENVLNLYGTVIGINGTASARACRTVIGYEYTVDTFVNAYNAALGNGGSGGGGTTSSKRPSTSGGSYNMSMVEGEQANQPLQLNFADIDGVDWAVEAILGLADKGILNGKGEGLFKPHETVTREEFVKILIGAMNLSEMQYQNHFADVKDDDWFVKYVNIAYEAGIVRGIDAANFGVGTSISRQDMAVMLYNALQYKGSELGNADTAAFEDGGAIADYAKAAVDGMVSIGALNGVSDTRFEPAGEATRAQAATVIWRILSRLQ